MQKIRGNHWHIAEVISPEADQALQEYPPFMRQILYNRGITTAQSAAAYLSCSPEMDYHPMQILGMEDAVERIWRAVDQGEPTAVYGDYDVDGVTATALLVQVLQKVGANVVEYIPNRFDEGYGLNREALTNLQSRGIRLVITVDCGIRSMEEAECARDLGLDLIITDHHHCLEEIPAALAVINTRQKNDTYPDKELAGVGLAYKLAQGLLLARPGQGIRAEDWLDLVALGTVADMAPLMGENRCLVRAGLDRMRTQPRQGVYSLAMIAGLNLAKVTAGDIGFTLGPRLNAAGRLESAEKAFQLLTTESAQEAGELAQYLNEQNRQRQDKTREIQARVEEMVFSAQDDTPLIFACDPSFNQGVVGLAASRLTDQYYRPAIVAHQSEELTRGSCRSIPEFHITEALDQCKDLLVKHGGHAAAAGFTVRNEHLGELIERLQAIAAEKLGDLSLLQRRMVADKEIPLRPLGEPLFKLESTLFRFLDQIQPTGYGNREPVFVSRNLRILQVRLLGKESQHLRLKLSDGNGSPAVNAIAFRQGHLYETLRRCETVDLMYTIERNEFQDSVSLQLNVRDIKPNGPPNGPPVG